MEFHQSITEQIAGEMKPAEAQKLIRGMCITRAPIAVATLEQICANPRMNPNARVAAATAILDRGFGRPEQNTSVIVPGSGKTGVMLVPSTSDKDEWLSQASAHHEKMLK